jgi:hypothetical protein
MFIAYYDEAGDDGFPNYSSPIFVLSCAYIHYLNYKNTYESIHQFRQSLKSDFGLPIKMEFHTRRFLMNKKPYVSLNLSDQDRILIVDKFCDFIATCSIKSVNVVICKKLIQNNDYNVLDKAFTYSIQRIENDILSQGENERFIIISDYGRIGKMRYTSRKIQKILYVQSQFSQQQYNATIRFLIEDPLPKESQESYFIQISDLISSIIYMYSMFYLGIRNPLPHRMVNMFDYDKIEEWMDSLRNIFNLEATKYHEYGIVYHPRPH